ncbi:MAG TPA: palindromic element RPE4 domain-containing protein [Rickettsia endosymbiont of Omalisus fontisbellaquei]|nr:palindromic element RPE4 domain-containing protein [Rickettsia endosymbiont of Omalisus fontisbellaquei]
MFFLDTVVKPRYDTLTTFRSTHLLEDYSDL